mmetsp:Transcript_33881/g.107611  ORF Transcript_33881/g.107611 Transcript_33881/m.107611 type:complete len:233 (-) Transcript_33881:1002-1700(-)
MVLRLCGQGELQEPGAQLRERHRRRSPRQRCGHPVVRQLLDAGCCLCEAVQSARCLREHNRDHADGQVQHLERAALACPHRGEVASAFQHPEEPSQELRLGLDGELCWRGPQELACEERRAAGERRRAQVALRRPAFCRNLRLGVDQWQDKVEHTELQHRRHGGGPHDEKVHESAQQLRGGAGEGQEAVGPALAETAEHRSGAVVLALFPERGDDGLEALLLHSASKSIAEA